MIAITHWRLAEVDGDFLHAGVDSAYRFVVSRLTWPSQPRITLTSTPDSRRWTAAVCRKPCGLAGRSAARVVAVPGALVSRRTIL